MGVENLRGHRWGKGHEITVCNGAAAHALALIPTVANRHVASVGEVPPAAVSIEDNWQEQLRSGQLLDV
jgi:hypothetical protein